MENNLLKMIDEAKVVSFDIFDTAIFRKLYKPQDVFSLVYSENREKLEDFPENFRLKREIAERSVRDRFEKKYGSREVTLKDIYDEMVTTYYLSPSSARTIMGMEIAVECDVCTKNQTIYKIYNYAVKQGKTVIFATDMYLPSEILESILRDNGYKKYHYIYVSSEISKSKREGHLFSHIQMDLGVRPKDILHIGDDELSDVIMGRKNGFKVFHYKKCAEKCCADDKFNSTRFVKNSIAKSIYKALVSCKFYNSVSLDIKNHNELDFWYRFGYENVGILYLGFIQWLVEEFRKHGVRHAYFLSRDGYIMQKVYEKFADKNHELPSCSYFHVSRLALALSSIENVDSDELDLFISDSELRNVDHYLKRFGLDSSKFEKEIIDTGFLSARSLISNNYDRQKLFDLLVSLKTQILEIADKQKKLFAGYLKEVGIDKYETIGIVDIGWKASMQKYLLEILQREGIYTSIFGFYLGTSREILQNDMIDGNAFGFLCQEGKPEQVFKTILGCVPLCEFLFSAPHGSVERYKQNENGLSEAIFDDKVIVEQQNVARIMQQGALDFVDDFTSLSRKYSSVVVENDLALAPFARVVKDPSYIEAVLIGDLRHIDSFDDVENARFLAKPPSVGKMINIKAFRRSYLQSYWKRGFIERLSHLKGWLPGKILKKLS